MILNILEFSVSPLHFSTDHREFFAFYDLKTTAYCYDFLNLAPYINKSHTLIGNKGYWQKSKMNHKELVVAQTIKLDCTCWYFVRHAVWDHWVLMHALWVQCIYKLAHSSCMHAWEKDNRGSWYVGIQYISYAVSLRTHVLILL